MFTKTNEKIVAMLLLFSVAALTKVFALDPPTGVDWLSDSESAVTFSWTNSTSNARVQFQWKRGEADWSGLGITGSGAATLRLSPVLGGDRFRLRTVTVDAEGSTTDSSGFTEEFVIATRNDLEASGWECVIESPGEINLALEAQGFTFEELGLTGLPEGVALVDSPPRIVGPIASGVYNITVFGVTGKHRREAKVELIITEAPNVTSPISELSATQTAPSIAIELNDVFADPDTTTVVRMDTVLGNIDVALNDAVAPKTVAAFLAYVDSGALDGTFVHNSVNDSFSILQAGQYIPRDDGKLQRIPVDTSLSSADFDASSPNVCGTISMLKPTGDTASNQWLLNFGDNSAALDRFYAAFGRVMGTGMSVVNSISELPVTSENAATVVSCEGTPPNQTCTENLLPFEDWPLLRIRESGLDTDDLVTIRTISRIPTLTFAVVSNSAPDVAMATVSDAGALTVDYLAPGQTTITIGATDRDGASTSHTFTVSVQDSFEAWALSMGLEGGQAVPIANPDDDDSNNLLEYAFGGNPLMHDSLAIEASLNPAGQAEPSSPSITFLYRANAGDLEYAVQLSSTLATGWSDIWTSADGLDAPNIVSSERLGSGLLKLTVSAPSVPLPAFLRAKASSR